MHLLDTVFIFCLALIIFGPKKLPEIARQIGKLMAEFRRASNDFKMQIDEELRASEQAEQQKQISTPASAAVAAAAASASGYEPSTTPAILPPATGTQVSHSFSPPDTPVETESSSQPTYEAAFPEAATAFETSTNGHLPETETISPVPFATPTPLPAEGGPEMSELKQPLEDPAHLHHG